MLMKMIYISMLKFREHESYQLTRSYFCSLAQGSGSCKLCFHIKHAWYARNLALVIELSRIQWHMVSYSLSYQLACTAGISKRSSEIHHAELNNIFARVFQVWRKWKSIIKWRQHVKLLTWTPTFYNILYICNILVLIPVYY